MYTNSPAAHSQAMVLPPGEYQLRLVLEQGHILLDAISVIPEVDQILCSGCKYEDKGFELIERLKTIDKLIND